MPDKKLLDARPPDSMVPPPFSQPASVERGGRRHCWFDCKKNVGTKKGIDGSNSELLAETLSLLGKLFEIYFVRLIGTPNQNSNTTSDLKMRSH